MRPRVLEDAYLRSDEIEALWCRLARAFAKGPVRRGGWDTMHATSWRHAWTDDAAPVVLVDAGGARSPRIEGERLVLPSGIDAPRHLTCGAEEWLNDRGRSKLEAAGAREGQALGTPPRRRTGPAPDPAKTLTVFIR